jgi:ribosome-associated translation inhibitor RaiA/cold shock CspA family protein
MRWPDGEMNEWVPRMQIPAEIAFHNVPPHAWAEEEIRARIAKLEKIYDRMVTCRVRVDQRAKNSNGTIPPVVHIEMGIPGRKDLVVSHEPDHLQQKFQRPDLHNAINEAFRIAEDQLVQFKDKLQDRGKEAHHDTENQLLGQIAEVTPDEDFGFLMTSGGGLLHFHRDSVLVGRFEKLKRGDEVFYVQTMGDTGITATKVRVKSAD